MTEAMTIGACASPIFTTLSTISRSVVNRVDIVSWTTIDRNRLDGPKIGRVDVVVFVILVILAFLVFSIVSLYFKRLQLAFILVTKHVRSARKKKRRMLLPLSM
ncbi:unnamed protein product [Eruca vesicaria subsp. sativa]|uniref:Uncharacterized protein n=1 Tax=Eruca vesicaria subsp. sativa TaxID=29727 RepID=A0ABC8LG19_ERUVS|nr:unnamed protein product [Eruca vesicaria subsp. sativa]